MRVAVAIAVAVAALSAPACRGPAFVKSGAGCAIATGQYLSDSWLVSSEGACDRAKAHSFDRIAFDASGAFVSPAGALLPCTTRQRGCALSIACDGVVISARVRFDGSLSEDAQALAGEATLSGLYDGCRSAVYDVSAERQP